MRLKPTHHSSIRATCRGALVVLVLVGYLFVLYSSSGGQGWRLLIHLSQEHQSASAVPAKDTIFRTLNPDRTPTPHHHNADGTHTVDAASHNNKPPATTDGHMLHEHDGKIHTHEQKPDAEEALLVILTLDQHYLFANPSTPVPLPARDANFADVPAVIFPLVFFVDTPPPRHVA